MKLKLVIDGSDMRVRITPEGNADKKLLEFIAQMDIGRVKVERKNDYGYSTPKDVSQIDLLLENEIGPNGETPIVDYPVSD